MEPQRWEQIQSVFSVVADLPPDQKRHALHRLCENDHALMTSVLDLLQEDALDQALLDSDADRVLGRIADATLSSDHLRFLVQRQIGPYRLLRILGEGGMGVVYLAERSDIGGMVAIKLLRDAWLSPMRRERFVLEQQTLVKLNHPSIARIYDASAMEDGTPWFVMEYVDGRPITDFLHQRGGSLGDDLAVFQQVCEAVQYAHRHAVIHRDLKPSNILVAHTGEVKLLDFGIAKQIDTGAPEITRTVDGLRLMTPGYAAPEQGAGGSIGTFTDVYSLGVLLYEMLTGRLPARAPADTLIKPSALVRGARAAARRDTLSRQQWSELDVLCLTALASEPGRRYRSVDALSGDVAAFLEGRPLQARPSSLLYVSFKFARRNSVALSTTAGGLALLLGASLLFTVRLAHARDAALVEARRTERIQRFMQNMLGDEDVAAGPANDLKVVTLLDRAEQQAGSLGADAETQAQLYQTIGSMYARLGRYAPAERALTQALDGAKKFEGPEGKNSASILVQLATVRGDHGELQQARRDVEQALAIATASHQAGSDTTLIKARVAEGRIDLQSGQYQKAIDVLSPIAERRAANAGATPYDQRDSFTALSEALLYTHRYDLAEAASRRALKLDRQLLGDSHPQTSEDLMDLGAVKSSLGSFAEAETLYRQGLSILQGWYGPEHPDVVMGTSVLARILVSEGKDDEAEGLVAQCLESEEKAYGPVHERVAFTLNALAELALRRGKYHAAEANFHRAISIYRALFGENNVHTATAESNLGHVYLKESRNTLAEATLRQATTALDSLPNGSNYIGLTRGRWGEALLALQRYKEAEQQLHAANELMTAMAHPPGELADIRTSLTTLDALMHNSAKRIQR